MREAIVPRIRVIKVSADKPTEEVDPLTKTAIPVAVPVESPNEEVSAAPSSHKKTPSTQVHQGIVITKKSLVILCVGGAAVLLIILAITNRQSIDSPGTASNPKAAQSEASKYQEELGKVVDLPQGKTPTFSTVDDAAKLAAKSPTLFKNAQNGDVFLVYLNDDKTGKVVLYRPSTKKVILFIDGVDLGQQNTNTGAQN